MSKLGNLWAEASVLGALGASCSRRPASFSFYSPQWTSKGKKAQSGCSLPQRKQSCLDPMADELHESTTGKRNIDEQRCSHDELTDRIPDHPWRAEVWCLLSSIVRQRVAANLVL